MSPQTVVLIGRSGCGKGTQAKLLADYLQKEDTKKRPVYFLETGAGFREFIKGEKYTNKLANEFYTNDIRQPDFLAIWMWSNQYINALTGEEHLFMDGMPRGLIEAMALNNAMEFYKRPMNIVYLNVSRETAEKRLLDRGRMDDVHVSKITKRLNWFDRDVVPGIDYLRQLKSHNFLEINGDQSVEKVHADIIAAFKIF